MSIFCVFISIVCIVILFYKYISSVATILTYIRMYVRIVCIIYYVALPFLQFGENKKYLANDASDSVSEAISIPLGFPFGSTIQTLAYVSGITRAVEADTNDTSNYVYVY